MHFTELTAPEQRVLGCLIEKRFTTPDQYPLSINALRLASNQSTNRDPVVNYDDHTIGEAAQRLSQYGLARLASGHTSRAVKYRHLAEEALSVNQEELAVLCVLLLRGPQTVGELKGRTERMVAFGSLDDVEATILSLSDKGYLVSVGRRPGQKENRFGHLLGGAPEEGATDPAPTYAAPPTPSPVVAGTLSGGPPGSTTSVDPATPRASTGAIDALTARVEALEAEVAELRAALGG